MSDRLKTAIHALAIAAGIVAALAGCTRTPPAEQRVVIEVKGEPALAAAVASGIEEAREGAGWIKAANDERSRLLAEESAVVDAGRGIAEYSAISALSKINGEYERRRKEDWPSAAEWYVNQVQGKRLADFAPVQAR